MCRHSTLSLTKHLNILNNTERNESTSRNATYVDRPSAKRWSRLLPGITSQARKMRLSTILQLIPGSYIRNSSNCWLVTTIARGVDSKRARSVVYTSVMSDGAELQGNEKGKLLYVTCQKYYTRNTQRIRKNEVPRVHSSAIYVETRKNIIFPRTRFGTSSTRRRAACAYSTTTGYVLERHVTRLSSLFIYPPPGISPLQDGASNVDAHL